jgi:hypothetical protein
MTVSGMILILKAMVICDPPLARVYSEVSSESLPFQPNFPVEGGYNDFIPFEERVRASILVTKYILLTLLR